MTSILVLSDIHIPTRMKEFPYKLFENRIKDIDIIFALGDYVEESVIDILYSFKRDLYLVSGNMDDVTIKSKLPVKLEIKIEDLKIGLIHGWGAPLGIRERIKEEFDSVNLICYGHTHSSFFNKEKNIYFFNPGALCDEKNSFGILKIKNREILEASIISS